MSKCYLRFIIGKNCKLILGFSKSLSYPIIIYYVPYSCKFIIAVVPDISFILGILFSQYRDVENSNKTYVIKNTTMC